MVRETTDRDEDQITENTHLQEFTVHAQFPCHMSQFGDRTIVHKHQMQCRRLLSQRRRRHRAVRIANLLIVELLECGQRVDGLEAPERPLSR